MESGNDACLNSISNKMTDNFYMFGSLVEHEIVSYV